MDNQGYQALFGLQSGLTSGTVITPNIVCSSLQLTTAPASGYIMSSDAFGNAFWSPQIAGPTGATGPIGLVGPTGPIGVAGATGPIGPQGINGETGPTGPIGPTGGVISIAGSTNGVLVNGTTGVAQTGTILLTLPQEIGPTSTVNFNQVNAPILYAQTSLITPLINPTGGTLLITGDVSGLGTIRAPNLYATNSVICSAINATGSTVNLTGNLTITNNLTCGDVSTVNSTLGQAFQQYLQSGVRQGWVGSRGAWTGAGLAIVGEGNNDMIISVPIGRSILFQENYSTKATINANEVSAPSHKTNGYSLGYYRLITGSKTTGTADIDIRWDNLSIPVNCAHIIIHFRGTMATQAWLTMRVQDGGTTDVGANYSGSFHSLSQAGGSVNTNIGAGTSYPNFWYADVDGNAMSSGQITILNWADTDNTQKKTIRVFEGVGNLVFDQVISYDNKGKRIGGLILTVPFVPKLYWDVFAF